MNPFEIIIICEQGDPYMDVGLLVYTVNKYRINNKQMYWILSISYEIHQFNTWDLISSDSVLHVVEDLCSYTIQGSFVHSPVFRVHFGNRKMNEHTDSDYNILVY